MIQSNSRKPRILPAGKFMMLCLTAMVSGDPEPILHGDIVLVRSDKEKTQVRDLYLRALNSNNIAPTLDDETGLIKR